jgi:predicted enzyme related to lactoylglutathione lyase
LYVVMDILRTTFVFDAADIEAESSFWAAMYGGTVEADDDWHTVVAGGEAKLDIQLAPNHVRPAWPGGDQQQQAHLDLHVPDIRAADEEARGLGAVVLQKADLSKPSGFVVYADPAGHPFCLCWG